MVVESEDRVAAEAVKAPDFRALFERCPGLYLVLDPDFVIVAVSDAYASATMTKRQEILGRGIFEVFPDNPDDPKSEGVRNLRASLNRVRRDHVVDTMPVQKYDIRQPESSGGGFEERFWSPVNSPVIGPKGTLDYIIHRVEDVTDFVRLKLRESPSEVSAASQAEIQRIESEILLRRREVAETSRQLKEANAELQRAEEESRRAQVFLDSIIENIPNMIFVKDANELRFVRLNKAGEKLLGVTQADVIGKNDYDFFPENEAACFVNADRTVLENRCLLDIPEESIPTRALGIRILHTKKIPLLDATGNPGFLLGISEDITERKRSADQIEELNSSLMQQTLQLQAANRELEAFSYCVSHDLRAPLRSLDGFSRALIEDYGDRFDETATDYLQRIRGAAQRMGQLIDDLLGLSRMTRAEMHTQSVDLTAMGKGIVEELKEQFPDRNVYACVHENMSAQGDSHLLRAAVQNLLNNAWKYTARKATARITFGQRSVEGSMAFFVEDDGAGFDMTYANRLFGAFQRLHGSDEFEGTGIGLATVHRIISRHGGRVWAQGEVGRGATFYFALPGPTERGD